MISILLSVIQVFILNLFLPESAVQDSSSKNKKVNVTGIALPSRTPENGFLVQGGIVALYKTKADDSLLRASNCYLYGMYSQLKQWRVSVGGDIFTPQEKYYISYWYYYSYTPEKYFGIGEVARPDSSEFISYYALRFETSVLRKLYKNHFLGLQHYFENMSTPERPSNGLFEKTRPLGSQSYIAHGLGLKYRHDSRDFLLSATKGYFAEFGVCKFSTYLGSNYDFALFWGDFRRYYRIIPKKSHIIALQLYLANATGEIPFRWLPSIGTRAYHPNIYRDRSVGWLQTEYRLPIWKNLGMSVFGGVAYSNSGLKYLFKDEVKPNYGLGLRFKVIPKYNLHLRIDYGIGGNTSNYYIAFYDAF